MKKNQILALLLAAVMLLAVLTGCAAKTEPAQTEPAQTETAPAEEPAPAEEAEPAEEPADTCVREALEETGVDIEPVCLVSVKSSPYMVTYANGDQCQYMDLLFLCCPREDGNAQPRVADDESLEVGWFAPDALPQPLATSTRSRLELVQRFKQNAAQGNPACLFASNLI